MHRLTPLLSLALASCFYVTEAERGARWDLDGDGLERPTDCDDGDASLGERRTFFADTDGDGFGDRTAPVIACERPEGAVEDDTDCDDADPATFPGAPERCDGADNDCDEAIDEGLSQIDWYPDVDGDGWGGDEGRVQDCGRPDGYLPTGGDCDDGDPDANPDQVELACNEVDDDCDEEVDEAGAVLPRWYADLDGDDWGDDDQVADGCEPPPSGVWILQGGDCAPTDPAIHPDADEVCNGLDDDCNELVDDDPLDPYLYFPDADEDGYGDEDASGVESCDPVPAEGLVVNNFDCDDGDETVNPAAAECLDGFDNDCDGLTDEASCLR